MNDYSKEQNLVNRFILQNQTVIIEALFKSEFFSLDDIEYYPASSDSQDAEGNQSEAKILEWWLVDSWFAEKLHLQGEVIICKSFCSWWGRTCSGQAICMDTVIKEIAKSI